MASSTFAKKRMVKVAAPKEQMLRKSNFAGGLNTLMSIEELPENESPYLRNVRNVHQGSIGTRKGPGFYSHAGGRTQQANQISTTGATNISVTAVNLAASSFVPTSTARLTSVDLNLKTGTTMPTAPLLVEIWSNASGAPAVKLAGSSLSVASVTTSYQYVTCRFIEAPLLTSGTTYWIVTYMQGGVGSYSWSASSTYATGSVSNNSGTSWTAGNGMNLKTWLSTDGGTLGGERFTFSSGTKVDLIAIKEATGTTGVYSINANTGALTAISTGLSSSATFYSFEIFNDIVVYVNGYDAPHQWDGTTDSALVVTPVTLTAPAYVVKSHKNHLFLLERNTNRVIFSQPGDISASTGWPSTNFIYVPSPKSGDPVNSMWELQDNLWFGTRKTKYVLYGADLSSFTLRKSTAVKGVMGPTCVTVDGNFAYFVSDDGIYSISGSTDQLLSKEITPDFQNIADITKGSIIVWNNTLRYYCVGPGSAVCNQMLSLDLVNGGWFYDTNQYISQVFKYKSLGDPLKLVECSSLVGAAFYAEQQYSDLGKPIKLEYFDTPLALGDPGVYKQILFLYMRFAAQSGNYTVDCQVDKDLQNSPASTFVQQQGSGSLWGTAIWGQFTWGQPNFIEATIPVNGENRWYQVRLVITGADCPIELQGYTMYYLSQAPR